MNDRARDLLASISREDLRRVASGAVGEPVTLSGEPKVSAIQAAHAEKRTIGVVKVAGEARLADGSQREWSSVAKLVDMREATDEWTRWTRPEIEEVVYAEGYFARDGSRFRPARCYLVSTVEDGIKVFWLEDLTGAGRHPFPVQELEQIARHLGEWTGRHLTPPDLKFGLPKDIYWTRVNLPVFQNTYELAATLDEAEFRPYYRDVPVATMHECRALLRAQNERASQHPHGLAFGDCQVGNLFLGDDETIAVDWTSLASDPVGADGGALIGSAFTWGKDVAEVARHERDLFETYLSGLVASGWRGNRDDVRRGYYCHFGHYLLTGIALLPVTVAHNVWPPGAMEKRFGVRTVEMADLVAPIIAMLPGYVEELRELADRPR